MTPLLGQKHYLFNTATSSQILRAPALRDSSNLSYRLKF